ncbi:LPXTG cell wall anchor domain-containing protein [Clostridium baratii]|uniref:LPXTG cell wall anchor domain-containing protein n=1 Tax=Clostridium baratii TaxID=1561 RepID=UPI002914F40F|nr:LPXTG cell wall anchor domain-containing protein [Clostridium baratii]MDU4910920.1 LPXTG cell wall anchor domain-containing protein [Clostridium baratii]
MKKIINIVMLSVALLLIAGTRGDAKEFVSSNVKLEGNANGIVYLPGDEPFLELKNMVPGDNIKRRLILSNEFTDSYEIFIRAERITEKEENDLLEKLKMKIIYNNSLLHDGNATGWESIKENTSLGKIAPGESKELVAEVKLDGPSTGNEYKGKRGEVNWVFTAVRIPSEDNVMPSNPPKTGDDGVLGYLRVIILCLIAIRVINRKGKKA